MYPAVEGRDVVIDTKHLTLQAQLSDENHIISQNNGGNNSCMDPVELGQNQALSNDVSNVVNSDEDITSPQSNLEVKCMTHSIEQLNQDIPRDHLENRRSDSSGENEEHSAACSDDLQVIVAA